ISNGFGELVRVDELDGSATATTTYSYDGAGRLSTVLDADLHQTLLAHDGEGHRTAITRLPGNRTWNYTYDANGQLFEKTDPDQRITDYYYDDAGKPSLETVTSLPTMSAAHANELGIGSIYYEYNVSSGNSSADLPAAQRNYEYLNRSDRLDAVYIYS